VASAQERDRYLAAVAWLSPLDFRTAHNSYVAMRQEGTLQWLFQNFLFQGWLEGNTKFLWCPGIRKLPFLNGALFRIMLIFF
jgi:hypothetical protein